VSWLIWRQHRKQLVVTLVALVALAAVMVPSGLAIHRSAAELGLPECVRQATAMGTNSHAICGSALERFSELHVSGAFFGVLLFVFAPLLIGLFWGAPLVAREVEQGTHRLVWTQGVSRQRWVLTKIAFVGVVALVISAVYGLGLSWWMAPLNLTGSRFGYMSFDMQGVVPIGYTLFAVALGVFAGTFLHRLLPAMAMTLGGFVAVRVAIAALARPRYMAAEARTYQESLPDEGSAEGEPSVIPTPGPSSGRPREVGDWMLGREFRDSTGVGNDLFPQDYAYTWELFQPANRFWPFQAIEAGIFVALAALLFALAVRRIRRIA
jgi:hypothetical protein